MLLMFYTSFIFREMDNEVENERKSKFNFVLLLISILKQKGQQTKFMGHSSAIILIVTRGQVIVAQLKL